MTNLQITPEEMAKAKADATNKVYASFQNLVTLIDAMPALVDELTSSSLKKILIASWAYPVVGLDRSKMTTKERNLMDHIMAIKDNHDSVLIGSILADKKEEEIVDENK
jgi:hypothetical protein